MLGVMIGFKRAIATSTAVHRGRAIPIDGIIHCEHLFDDDPRVKAWLRRGQKLANCTYISLAPRPER